MRKRSRLLFCRFIHLGLRKSGLRPSDSLAATANSSHEITQMLPMFSFSLFSDKLLLLFPNKKPDAQTSGFLISKIINSILHEGSRTRFFDSLPDLYRLRY